jgi:putative transposase
VKSHKHLKRLDEVWLQRPIWFVTTCTYNRSKILDNEKIVQILKDEWHSAPVRHEWAIGNYVVMPDHVHFFCSAISEKADLSSFIGKWKEWTSKTIVKTLNRPAPIWQSQFFDHLLRSNESYNLKWEYVRENPVRAGLVKEPEDWPYWGKMNKLD